MKLCHANPTPFSEIARDRQFVVQDMDSWLNDIDRYQHSDGKPKRKLNAFMCYRGAYAEAIKGYLRTRQSHVVSSKCGEFWRTESLEIRDYYHSVSQKAHQFHESLFPDYKYQPQKKNVKENPVPLANKVPEDVDSETDAEHEIISLEEWLNL
jgi:hypothetical protein